VDIAVTTPTFLAAQPPAPQSVGPLLEAVITEAARRGRDGALALWATDRFASELHSSGYAAAPVLLGVDTASDCRAVTLTAILRHCLKSGASRYGGRSGSSPIPGSWLSAAGWTRYGRSVRRYWLVCRPSTAARRIRCCGGAS
jgi:hypothetical protein